MVVEQQGQLSSRPGPAGLGQRPGARWNVSVVGGLDGVQRGELQVDSIGVVAS